MTAVVLSPTGIRTDLVARLVAAGTAAGSRVYDSRQIDVMTDELPAIVVLGLGHDDRRDPASNVLLFARSEHLLIVALTTATSDTALAAAVDTLEAQLLAALVEDLEWNGSFESVGSFEAVKSLDVDTRKRVGGVGVRFDVAYHVKYVPSLTGMDLEEVAVTTDSIEPAGADVSERVIAVGPTP